MNHTLTGFAIGHQFQLPTEQCALVAGISLMPDAIGKMEKWIKNNPDAWVWYNFVHELWFGGFLTIVAIALTLLTNSFLPIICAGGWLAHIVPDVFLHSPDGTPIGQGNRWWVASERLWVEILSWLLLITYFLVSYI